MKVVCFAFSAKSFRKKNNKQTWSCLLSLNTLYYWRVPPLNSPIKLLITRTYFYLSESLIICVNLFKSFRSVRISSFCENLFKSFLSVRISLNIFFLCGSFLIFSYLWSSLRIFWISSYLWSHVQISPFLWELIFIHENLFFSWELFFLFICGNLCLYDNKQAYEFHHLKQISCYQNMIMIFCLFDMLLFCAFCFEFFSFYLWVFSRWTKSLLIH